MATLNLGRLKPVFRSTWNSSTAYNVDDIVVRNNQSYISIQAGTNQDPATATAYWTLMAAKGSDGTDVGATLANKEIAFKTNAGAVDGIPIGNAGEFLKVNSGATGYEFGAVSSDFVKLGQANISNASEAVFDGLFTSDYKMYKIYGYGIYTNVSNNDLQFRVNQSGSENSSSVYNNTNWYVYTDTTPSHNINVQGSSTNDMDAPGDAWKINFDGFSNDSNRPSFLELTLADPLQASAYKMAEWHHYYHGQNTNIMQSGNGHGVWKSNNAISGIRIQGQAGNYTGNFTLYGIKN